MKNVAVFFGGVSVEHDVSVITGALTVNSIDKTKYNGIPIYVDRDGKWYTGQKLKDVDQFKNLSKKGLKQVALVPQSNVLYEIKSKRIKPICALSVAINCMHGERGEDGSLAGLLKMCDIPLCSPSQLPSSVCMDKAFTKTVMKGLGIRTLAFVTLFDQTDYLSVLERLKFPVVVKPACLGSSIGISRANDIKELERAVIQAFEFGEKVIVEECLTDFIEINCAVYRDLNGVVKVSECERPQGKEKLLSFEDKYVAGGRVFPADIDKKLSDKIKSITKKVYLELFAEGVIRIDYFISQNKVYLNEINTVPGSLSYYLFGDTLKSFTKMLNELLARSEIQFNRSQTIKKSFKTSILSLTGSKGLKRL